MQQLTLSMVFSNGKWSISDATAQRASTLWNQMCLYHTVANLYHFGGFIDNMIEVQLIDLSKTCFSVYTFDSQKQILVSTSLPK